MGRPTSFDPDSALAAALDTFWQHGYGASSVQALLDAMQLNRGSLYHSFGDKEALFRRTLDLYFDRHTTLVIELLDSSANPVEGIAGVFEWTLAGLPDQVQKRGCILVNSVAELGHTDPDLARHAYAHLDKVREAIVRTLERARRDGLWRTQAADAHAVADLLFHFLTGLRVTTRLHADPDRIRASVRATLELVGLDTTGVRP